MALPLPKGKLWSHLSRESALLYVHGLYNIYLQKDLEGCLLCFPKSVASDICSLVLNLQARV